MQCRDITHTLLLPPTLDISPVDNGVNTNETIVPNEFDETTVPIATTKTTVAPTLVPDSNSSLAL